MVSRPWGVGGSWVLFAGAACGLAFAQVPVRDGPGAEPSYPWYDAQSDRYIPLWPDPEALEPGGQRAGGDGAAATLLGMLGQMVVTAVLALILALVVGLLVFAWLKSKSAGDDRGDAPRAAPGSTARNLELPDALRGTDWSDPWAAAVRLRDAGDLAGAIVALFAFELKALAEAGHIRLEPGRTGRQLVRSIADARLRAGVEPALRLFEASYYGQREVVSQAFLGAWSGAERMQAVLAGSSSAVEGAVT